MRDLLQRVPRAGASPVSAGRIDGASSGTASAWRTTNTGSRRATRSSSIADEKLELQRSLPQCKWRPCNDRNSMERAAAGNVGPIPRFPGNSRLDSQLSLKRSGEVSLGEHSWHPNDQGGANDERISIPDVTVFSQQPLTSFDHYESAWRTENTGLNAAWTISRVYVRSIQ